MFLEVEEGGQDRDGESSKNLIIRFIVDLPLWLVESLHRGRAMPEDTSII